MADLYETIYTRRDVRSEFIDKPVPEELIARALCAAHHAPSVGLSQPWHFLVIDDGQIKQKVHTLFQQSNADAIRCFSPKQQHVYSTLKLEGILESAFNLCISCDRRSDAPVLGRTQQFDTDLYSVACAVQNFWLAARAEDLGVGWVSIMDPQKLGDVLGLPKGVIPLAYLCVGYVSEFQSTPDLVRANWSKRKALTDVVYKNSWEQPCVDSMAEAIEAAIKHREAVLKP